MPNRYWVGGAATWDATAGTKWALTSGGAGGQAVPTSADDVFFDAASGSVSVATNAGGAVTCRNLDFTGFTGTWTGGVGITIYGSFTLSAGMTKSASTALTFVATTTGHTISFAGKTMSNNTVFSGVGGEWTLQDTWNNGNNNITLTNGSLVTNGQTVTCGVFSSNNSNVRSLTLGASVITCATNWTFTTTTNLTFSAGTSTLLMIGSSSFSGGGLTYYDVTFSGAAVVMTGANTFNNLTYTGLAAKTLDISLAADIVVATFAINGNSDANRILVYSSVVGTPRTITAATVSCSNVDFQDITGAGAASWNLSAISGGAGDCGGNSGITFTTGVNLYWFSNTGNSSDSTKWFLGTGGTGGAGRSPLPQDSLFCDANSFTGSGHDITIDNVRLPGINFTGATNNPNMVVSVITSIFGSVTLIPAMTISTNTANWTFAGRGSYTINSAGVSWNKNLFFIAPGGTYTLQADLTIISNRTLSIQYGTFDADNYNVTTGIVTSSVSGQTRAIIMGSGVWTLTDNATTIWNTTTSSGLTVTPETAIIVCNYSGSTGTRTFNSSGQAVPPVYVTGGTDTFATASGSLWRGLDFTGFAGTWSGTGGQTLSEGDLVVSATLTRTFTGALIFSAASGSQTIYSNGIALASAISISGTGGTVYLGDNMVNGSSIATSSNGNFDMNGFDCTSTIMNSSGSGAKSVNIRTGTWTLTGTGTIWRGTQAGLTVSASLGTVKMTDSSVTEKTFAGGGHSYGIVWMSPGAGTGTYNISGTETFTTLKNDGTEAHSILFSAGNTFTFTNWQISGSAGKLKTIGSITAANHNLVKAGGGTISADYLSISRSQASPGTTFYAGANSTDGGNNSGWIFTAAPSLDTYSFFMFF